MQKVFMYIFRTMIEQKHYYYFSTYKIQENKLQNIYPEENNFFIPNYYGLLTRDKEVPNTQNGRKTKPYDLRKVD